MIWWERRKVWLKETVPGRCTIALFWLVVLFCALSFIAPFTTELCTYNAYVDKEYCRQENLVIVALTHLFRFLDSTSAFVTAIATAWLTWITLKLVKIDAEGAETTKAQLRAYIAARPRGLRTLADGTVEAFVAVKNAGQTPAFNVTIPAAVRILPPPPYRFQIATQEIPDDEVSNMPTFTMSSGGEQTCAPKRKFTREEIEKAQAEKHRLYVFGLVSYTDIFGDNQWVEFCAYLDIADFLSAILTSEADKGRIVEAPFKVTPFGNDVGLNPLRAAT